MYKTEGDKAQWSSKVYPAPGSSHAWSHLCLGLRVTWANTYFFLNISQYDLGFTLFCLKNNTLIIQLRTQSPSIRISPTLCYCFNFLATMRVWFKILTVLGFLQVLLFVNPTSQTVRVRKDPCIWKKCIILKWKGEAGFLHGLFFATVITYSSLIPNPLSLALEVTQYSNSLWKKWVLVAQLPLTLCNPMDRNVACQTTLSMVFPR